MHLLGAIQSEQITAKRLPRNRHKRQMRNDLIAGENAQLWNDIKWEVGDRDESQEGRGV